MGVQSRRDFRKRRERRQRNNNSTGFLARFVEAFNEIQGISTLSLSLSLSLSLLFLVQRSTIGERREKKSFGEGNRVLCSFRPFSTVGPVVKVVRIEVAKENADVIVLDDNFTTIINVAKWGRAVYINIQKFVQFQLTVNVVALMINFVSACITGNAPLTAVQLLWVNMIMDTLGALALATEPPNDDMMKRPPTGRGENFITKAMWRNIAGQSVYQLVVLGVLMFKGKSLLKLTGSDSDVILNTFIFNTFVFCQLFNEINSREMEKINVFRGFFTSWIFSIVLISTLVFQVIIVEFLGAFANTVPLSWQLWVLSVLIGSVSLIIAVILKCIPVGSGKLPSHSHNGYHPIPNDHEEV